MGEVFDDDDDDDDDVFKGLDYPVWRNPENRFYQMFSLRFRALVTTGFGFKMVGLCSVRYYAIQYQNRNLAQTHQKPLA